MVLEEWLKICLKNQMNILSMNGFDFLKLNFSEFYGDNTTSMGVV